MVEERRQRITDLWRRLKRGARAGLAIGLAVAAGGFLACRSLVATDSPPRLPTVEADVPRPQDVAREAGADVPPETATPDAATPDRRPTVDKQQHRKGMPVPDNMAE